MVDLTSIVPLHAKPNKSHFTCKYCHKTFIHEDRYIRHKCKQMKREDELKTPRGQAAWTYYQLWMRYQKRLAPNASAFLTSKYFRTFNNFVEFVGKVSLPKPDTFIWLMVEKKFSPTMWTTDPVYTIYLDFLDHTSTPLEQAKLSVTTLMDLADRRSVDVSDVFDVLEAHEVIHMLRVRKLSPWLLLSSKKFRLFYINRTTEEERSTLETIIRPPVWADRFANNTKSVNQIKQITAALDI